MARGPFNVADRAFAWMGNASPLITFGTNQELQSHFLWLRPNSSAFQDLFKIRDASNNLFQARNWIDGQYFLTRNSSLLILGHEGLGIWQGLYGEDRSWDGATPNSGLMAWETTVDTGFNGHSFGGGAMTEMGLGSIAAVTPLAGLDGDIAYYAAWNTFLNTDEKFALMLGVSPLRIRPANLASYVPLLNTGTVAYDWITGEPSTDGGVGTPWVDAPVTPPRSRQLYQFPTLVAQTVVPSIIPGDRCAEMRALEQREQELASVRRRALRAIDVRGLIQD